jgi:2-oxoacid:acceptor oxidoreductase gamma subunit (pyruvate/2-ketoisovalerate family)
MYKIKMHGLGGQGVVTATKILAHAVSLYEDKYARTIPAFGHERRGAPVYADLMLDNEPILLGTFVYEPDVVVLFSPSLIDRGIPIDKGTHERSILVVNNGEAGVLEQLRRSYRFAKIYHVDATAISLATIGADIPNGAMLGAFARTGIVSIDSVVQALKENFNTKQGEQNAQAARRAYRETEET